MNMIIKNLSDLNNYIGFVVLSAQNKFPRVGPFSGDHQSDLNHAFDQLKTGILLLAKKINDDKRMRQLQKMLDDSRNAYLEGDIKKGAHLLQDLQEIAFPDRFKQN